MGRRPIPRWGELSEWARAGLLRGGVDAAWCEAASDTEWLSALNLFAKLDALGLWGFVSRPAAPSEGNLELFVDDMAGLCAALRRRPDFSNPRPVEGFWDVRELRAVGSLHLKHFAGWPSNRLQAHVDRFGLWLRPWWWLLSPAAQLIVAALHGLDRCGYRQAESVRRIVAAQGGDRAILYGQAR